jgi:hypothetical protein
MWWTDMEPDAENLAATAVYDERRAQTWRADQLLVHRVAAAEAELQRVTACWQAVGDLALSAAGRPHGRRITGVSGCRFSLGANTLGPQHFRVTAGVPGWPDYERALTVVDGDGTVGGERAWQWGAGHVGSRSTG